MKQLRLKKFVTACSALLSSSLLIGLLVYQFTRDTSGIELVNEASRIAHAKELLGDLYQGSVAEKMEGKRSLNRLIHERVSSALPQKFKSQSKALASAIISESSKYNLDPIFVLAIIKTESKFNPNTIGLHGEIGLMQVKPDTAEWIASKYGLSWSGKSTLRNPIHNIKIGTAYMNYLREEFKGKAMRYVSAYNMGPNNVRKLISKRVKPTEYKTRVMQNYSDIYAKISDNNSYFVAENSSSF